MKVVVLPGVQGYLDALVPLLHSKGYFSYEEGAIRYIHGLLDEIRATLPGRLHRPAPSRFDPEGVGVWFASYRKNRNTTWYVFFTLYNDGGETVYLVRRIENNHTAAQYML